MEAIFPFKALPRFYESDRTEYFKIASVAVRSASQFYKTRLVTDKFSANIFKEEGIKFDEVEIRNDIEEYKGGNFAVPKILTMMSRTLPYVMLDFDTIITDKIPEIDTITFGFKEVDISKSILTKDLEYVYNRYFQPYHKYLYPFQSSITSVDWSVIPNMGLFYCSFPQKVVETYQTIIDEYSFDKLECASACVFEQLLLYNFLLNSNFVPSFLQEHNGLRKSDSKIYFYHFDSDERKKESHSSFIERMENRLSNERTCLI